MCALLAKIVRPFGEALGVPTGGTRVAEAMAPFAMNGPPLVVDDVWTTGGSMHNFIAEAGVLGAPAAVLFARGPTPPWVTALFTLHEGLWTA